VREWGYTVIEAESGEPGSSWRSANRPISCCSTCACPISAASKCSTSSRKWRCASRHHDHRRSAARRREAALKLGAYDFVGKPIDFDELHITIKNALEATSLRAEVQSLRSEVRRESGYDSVVSVSPKMTELMNFVRKVASSEATTILIQGESGTGKDLIAKAIHYESSARENLLSPSTVPPFPRR